LLYLFHWYYIYFIQVPIVLFVTPVMFCRISVFVCYIFSIYLCWFSGLNPYLVEECNKFILNCPYFQLYFLILIFYSICHSVYYILLSFTHYCVYLLSYFSLSMISFLYSFYISEEVHSCLLIYILFLSLSDFVLLKFIYCCCYSESYYLYLSH
jgi:hypothetical protein